MLHMVQQPLCLFVFVLSQAHFQGAHLGFDLSRNVFVCDDLLYVHSAHDGVNLIQEATETWHSLATRLVLVFIEGTCALCTHHTCIDCWRFAWIPALLLDQAKLSYLMHRY